MVSPTSSAGGDGINLVSVGGSRTSGQRKRRGTKDVLKEGEDSEEEEDTEGVVDEVRSRWAGEGGEEGYTYGVGGRAELWE